jgi:hypothetical protein
VNDFKLCGNKGCTKLFCPPCVVGKVMETHMGDACPKKPKPPRAANG